MICHNNYVVHRKEWGDNVLGNGLVFNVLDSQSLGARFDAKTEVYLSFFTCVIRVLLTIPSPGELGESVIIQCVLPWQ